MSVPSANTRIKAARRSKHMDKQPFRPKNYRWSILVVLCGIVTHSHTHTTTLTLIWQHITALRLCSHFQFLNPSQSRMNLLSAYKEAQLKTYNADNTNCILLLCTINSSTGVKGREATVFLFSLMTVALLPKCPFQDPRPSIYTLTVVAGSRMLPASACFAPKCLNRLDFWITSSPFLHYDRLTCIRKDGCNIMHNKQRVQQGHSSVVLFCASNQWTELQIDLAELALGIKLLLCTIHCCAYLRWLGQ